MMLNSDAGIDTLIRSNGDLEAYNNGLTSNGDLCGLNCGQA